MGGAALGGDESVGGGERGSRASYAPQCPGQDLNLHAPQRGQRILGPSRPIPTGAILSRSIPFCQE